MKEKYLIFSDISARFDEFYYIKKQYPKHIPISNGDLNDRFYQTKQLFDYFMKHKSICILGNHEDMMRDFFLQTNKYDNRTWFANGGIETVQSFIRGSKQKEKFETMANLFLETNDQRVLKKLIKTCHTKIDQKYIKFINNMKFYFETEEFICSHAPIKNNYSLKKFKKESKNMNIDLLWNRTEPFKNKGKTLIFGHNAERSIKQYTDEKSNVFAINLDSSFGDKLTALDWSNNEYLEIKNFIA